MAVIGSISVDCDPKQMSSTRAELEGILAWVTQLDYINSMYYLPLKITLHMCCDRKDDLKGLHKWLGTSTTKNVE